VAPARDPGRATFELTDKAIDFLGYRTLKDVLGGAGAASLGAHETDATTTGVETTGASRPYAFGDALNLDVTETFKQAARRGLEGGSRSRRATCGCRRASCRRAAPPSCCSTARTR
jgi:Ca-activated chloride channel homolog